jgi:hypothetical protein
MNFLKTIAPWRLKTKVNKMSKPETMMIDDIKYVRADSVDDNQPTETESMYKIGAKLFVRTVTYHYTGRVSFLSDKELVLSDAAWVASSGRFAAALETSELSEVEPYPGACSINRDVIVDCSPWNHKLPRGTK